MKTWNIWMEGYRATGGYSPDRMIGSSVGETFNEVEIFLDQELQEDYINEYTIDNPKIPGKKTRCIKLNRDSSRIIKALLPKDNEKAEP